MIFTLSRGDLPTFWRPNIDALELCRHSVADYLAARCLLINRMFNGFVMAEQALEKILKAHYIIRGGTKDIKKFSHYLVKIMDALKEECGYDITQYKPFFERMTQEFLNKYPDEIPGTWSTSGSDLAILDKLIFKLFDEFPAPIEYKLSAHYFGTIFSHVKEPGHPYYEPPFNWLIIGNSTLKPNLDVIINQCKELIAFWNLTVQTHHVGNNDIPGNPIVF